MIVSPPFLPEPRPETDAQFVERAMPGGAAGDGGFPVSVDLNWHGGVHLTAPAGPGGAALPVRAIADGTVAFVRMPTPQSGSPTHPLNYGNGWTDDGCVILRHETEIGADAQSGAATSVVFFSIYMHLRDVRRTVVQGHRWFRKDVLGTAGRIYGVENRLHFELICDDANVERLTGRSEPFTPVGQDGRSDAVFGAMWFMLLVNTPFYATQPQAGQPLPAVVHTNDEAYFVRIDLAGGAAVIKTCHLDGRPLADRNDADFEYHLLSEARARYPLSPAAGYELLRFGRVLGTDVLNPPDAPHYREVAFAGGSGWVDLNDARVRKFSDADFPHWDNWWVLVDGSSSSDSRCKDPKVLELLDRDNDWKIPPAEAQRSLNDPDRQRRLSRKICKHRSEWDASTFDAQYGWLKTERKPLVKPADFERMRKHTEALAFWPAAALGLDPVHWHFHPRLFITQFRQCGWFALDELTQLLPRWPTGVQTRNSDISFATARGRFQPYALALNRVFRKYNFLDAKRQTQFLAQTFIETALWRTMIEFGHGAFNPHAPATRWYAAFYGRGVVQTTWAANFEAYGTYRNFANVGAHYVYHDARITHVSLHYFQMPQVDAANNLVLDAHGNPVSHARVWYPRYDPEDVATNAFAACDSGAFYWVAKGIGGGQHNMHRVADGAFTPQAIATISWLVNGGGSGVDERERWAAYVNRFRSDTTDSRQAEVIVAMLQIGHGPHHPPHQHRITVDYTPQRP